uniref:Uncharacterized protein n=1 Tax=Globodera pallida TaxID=36090 RepID=A0A183C9V1_GLOPA
MGNLFSLEVISLDLHVYPPSTPDESPWKTLALPLLAIVLSLGALVGLYLRARHKPTRPTRPRTAWSPPFTLMVIIGTLILFASHAEGRPKGLQVGKGKASTHPIVRLGKPLAHGSASLLASTALYLGLNTLASVWEEDPGIPAALFAGVGLASLVLLLIILTALHRFLRGPGFPPRPRTPPHHAALELGELRSAITELVQRSDPPHH